MSKAAKVKGNYRDATPVGKKILVIPDAHAHPDVAQDRFHALGQFIVDKKPDEIVSIGDWADMSSLCFYDKGTIRAEGQRYTRDIDSANEAIDIVMGYVNAERQRLRKNKAKQWNPNFSITLGNHENRINTVQTKDASLAGCISTDDIKFAEAGWEVVPFLTPHIIERIAFQHYLVSGVMGKAVSGVNHARTLVAKAYMSCVVGHSHMFDWWEDARADHGKIFGCVVGCYEDLDLHIPDFAKSSAHHWWSGLVMLHDAKDGYAEHARYSLDYLYRKYKIPTD